MKGLLVKDFKLLKLQKNSLLYVLLISIGLILFSDNVSFSIGFLTFIFSLFSLTSISYDEFDNGNAFLFSLPITRTDYVIEKYCYGLILGFVSWFFSTILSVVIEYFKGTNLFIDTLTIALMILPLMLLTISIMFPFQLRFGGDKGRIAIICAFGFLFVVGIIIAKIAELANIDVVSIFNNLPVLSIRALVVVSFIIAIIILLISIIISVSIVKKKEF